MRVIRFQCAADLPTLWRKFVTRRETKGAKSKSTNLAGIDIDKKKLPQKNTPRTLQVEDAENLTVRVLGLTRKKNKIKIIPKPFDFSRENGPTRSRNYHVKGSSSKDTTYTRTRAIASQRRRTRTRRSYLRREGQNQTSAGLNLFAETSKGRKEGALHF